MPRRLIDELNDLHASYVKAINVAVADADLAAAEELARAYDEDALHLVADWENRTHLLPIRRTPLSDTQLRRLIRSLSTAPAA